MTQGHKIEFGNKGGHVWACWTYVYVIMQHNPTCALRNRGWDEYEIEAFMNRFVEVRQFDKKF